MRLRRVRPPEGITLIVSGLCVAILAIVIGYNIGNWALGLLLSPTELAGIETGSDYQAQTGLFSSTTEDTDESTDQAPTGEEALDEAADDVSSGVVVRAPSISGEVSLYKVRVGDFFTRGDADRVKEELESLGFIDTFIPTGLDTYAIQVGAFGKEDNANSLAQQLVSEGYDVYIVESVEE